jgi:lysyl-tRNA synthetase class I
MPCRTDKEQREYQAKWLNERRLAYLANKECIKCGNKEKLVIHHVDKTTKKNHRIWSWSESRRNEELAKCVVLCERCHKIEHGYVVDYHGTVTGHKYRGCRCERCKEARAAYSLKYRKSKEGKT